MKIGIDFGTSYSAASVLLGGQVVPILFNGSKQFRTAVFFPDAIPDPANFPRSENNLAWIERELSAMQQRQRAQKREKDALRARYAADAARDRRAAGRDTEQIAVINARLAEQLAGVGTVSERSRDDLYRDAERLVRRLWLEQEMNRPQQLGANLGNALFGEDAIEAFLAQQRGTLVQSPKSMLGQRMDERVKVRVMRIVTHTLLHIRRTATAQLGVDVTAATLGRPVQFRSSLGEAGGEQAERLLTEAALAAGFDAVDFLEEPRAAALKFHEEIRHAPVWAMVVDIGGGTSDIAWGTLGGSSPAPQIVGTHGGDFGGTDVDLKLNLEAFMPLFGRTQPGLSNAVFYAAACVTDLAEQDTFMREDFRSFPEPWRKRLNALQRTHGGTTLLNRAAETAKIRLGTQEKFTASLDEILGGCMKEAQVNVTRRQLNTALDAPASWLGRLGNLLRESSTRSARAPEVVFLTGGMSQAPFVQSAVRDVFPDARVVAGDASFGVVEGLGRFAAR